MPDEETNAAAAASASQSRAAHADVEGRQVDRLVPARAGAGGPHTVRRTESRAAHALLVHPLDDAHLRQQQSCGSLNYWRQPVAAAVLQHLAADRLNGL